MAEAADDTAAASLIAQVGQRVRMARQQKGIPRRVLSEMSQISPRYLAQLEAGEGNISIGLLQKVAVALDYPIEWLFGPEGQWDSETLRAAQMYHLADAKARRTVLQILSRGQDNGQRAQRIALVGLRGAGKSTLGALAGQALDIPFIELNREIEGQSGMPIAEVIALYGPEGYRMLEAQELARVIASHERMILAVSGGIVAASETYGVLLQSFHTIWLKAAPEEHMARVRAQGDMRPMAGNPAAMQQLKSILSSREALYALALAQIDTSGKSVDASTQDLMSLIENRI